MNAPDSICFYSSHSICFYNCFNVKKNGFYYSREAFHCFHSFWKKIHIPIYQRILHPNLPDTYGCKLSDDNHEILITTMKKNKMDKWYFQTFLIQRTNQLRDSNKIFSVSLIRIYGTSLGNSSLGNFQNLLRLALAPVECSLTFDSRRNLSALC